MLGHVRLHALMNFTTTKTLLSKRTSTFLDIFSEVDFVIPIKDNDSHKILIPFSKYDNILT